MSNRSGSSTITTLGDFKKSLENEKNIRKLFSNYDSNNPNASELGDNEKIMAFLEKNYKLQV